MQVLMRICEIILGLIFFGAGLNGYAVLFGFEPFAPTSPAAMDFLGEGYFLAMEKGVELVAGMLLIVRRFVPLVLVILAGIIVNIVAFHIFVDPELLLLVLFVLILESVLLWFYRDCYKGLLESQPRVR